MNSRDEMGRFEKGITPWNKGKADMYSKETLEKMKKAKLGKHMLPNTEFRRGHKTWNKGMKNLYICGSEKGWFKKYHKWSKEIELKKLRNLRKKIVLKPNLKMNENLAYIIGLLMGDGHVGHYDRSYIICLVVTNKKISNNFYNSLRTIGLHPFSYEIMPSNGIGKKKQFRVIANSKKFYEWYKELKIEKLKSLLDSKRKIIGFIKGFYEAEGSIYKQKDGTIVISIGNTDSQLLELVKSLLEQLGLNFRFNGPYENKNLGGNNSKPLYKLQTGAKNNVFNFLNLVKPSVKAL